MPLDEQKCDQILSAMRGLDVSEKLKAVNEARETYKNSFTENMTNKDFAYSVSVIETLYNLLREELRVSQIRIKKDTQSTANVSVPKTSSKKADPKKKFTMDFATLLKEFKESQGNPNANG